MLIVKSRGKLMMKKRIQVGLVDTVEGQTLIEVGVVQIDLGKRLGQGHTLWFDLDSSGFEERCGYTRCCCIQRDQDHEGIKHLLHRD